MLSAGLRHAERRLRAQTDDLLRNGTLVEGKMEVNLSGWKVVVSLGVVSAVLALGSTGCGGGGQKKATITAQDRAEAETLFTTRCAACHGLDGTGNGPGAAALNPKPRNYHDAAWQQATTDEEIEKAIVMGGSAVGKSFLMAANPDLQSKPGVVAALREKVRSFGQK
jgi:cytochrome c553